MKRAPKTFLLAGEPFRLCKSCGLWKVMEAGFYVTRRSKHGRAIKWGYECKRCAVKRQQRHKKEVLSRGGAQAAQMRAGKRRAEKNWRDKNPAKVRAARQRKANRVKGDPVRHARFLENRRIAYHLKNEREGTTTNRRLTAKRVEEKLPTLPVRPLVEFIEPFYESVDVNERQFRAWAKGERSFVAFDVADRILIETGTEWEDIWPPDIYPEIYEGVLAAA